MGCGTCKSECGREDGCGDRKAAQKVVLDGLIARLYPGRTWGQPDDEACFRAGLSLREVRSLAQALSVVLKAPAFVREGEPDDLCSFIYVLCLGRAPALVDVREEGLNLLASGGGLEPVLAIRERYLRLSCSNIARLVAIQEVAMELDIGRGQAPPEMAVLREVPQPGVFDPKLLKRFQKATDLVMAHDIEHLDMGLLDVPAAQFGLSPGEYLERYGVSPGLLNYFFYAQPVQGASCSYLPLPEAVALAS